AGALNNTAAESTHIVAFESRCYSLREMPRSAQRSRHLLLAVIVVLVLGSCCANALPQLNRRPSTHASSLQFDQSLALADFDGDTRVDEAKLTVSGRNKKVEIRLSKAAAVTSLDFETLTSDQGSLFAEDIDQDGDEDLIWSDLLHPDQVVVWLDDGGHFSR